MTELLERTISKCDNDLVHHSQIAYAILLPIDRDNTAYIRGIEKFYAYLEQVNKTFLLEVFKEDFRSMFYKMKHDYELYKMKISGGSNSWECYNKEFFLAWLDSPLAEGTEEYKNIDGYWDGWWEESRIFSYLDAIVYYLSGSPTSPSVNILNSADSIEDNEFV